MLVRWLGIVGLCVAIGIVLAVAPELSVLQAKPTQQVSKAEHQKLVRACTAQAQRKLKAMGPMVSSDPDEVRRKCKAAVDERVTVSN